MRWLLGQYVRPRVRRGARCRSGERGSVPFLRGRLEADSTTGLVWKNLPAAARARVSLAPSVLVACRSMMAPTRLTLQCRPSVPPGVRARRCGVITSASQNPSLTASHTNGKIHMYAILFTRRGCLGGQKQRAAVTTCVMTFLGALPLPFPCRANDERATPLVAPGCLRGVAHAREHHGRLPRAPP